MHPNKKAQTRDVPETRDATQETPSRKREEAEGKNYTKSRCSPHIAASRKTPLRALASNEVSVR